MGHRGVTGLALAWRFARRELRGGIKGFRILIACLALGVAAIAAVGSLSAAVEAGLARDAKAILGGDFELRLSQRPATAEQRAWLDRHGSVGGLAETIEMRAMAVRPDGAKRLLVQLKAVEGGYPLFGSLGLAPAQDRAALFDERAGHWGAAIESGLAVRLDLKVGDRLRVGEGEFDIRAILEREPDRSVSALDLGPRVMIGLEAMPATGLIQPGSLIEYRYKVRLAPGTDANSWRAELTRAFPDSPWRIRDASQASPGVERFVERISMFLTLVGLTSLLVGGVGVGNSVNAYLAGRTAAIATLKCLGASGRLVFTTYLMLVLVLAMAGILIGCAIGATAPWIAQWLLGGLLPVPLLPGLYWPPLALAALFGLLTAIAFSLWPLGRARAVRAASLFRSIVTPARGRPSRTIIAATGLAILALAGLAVGTAPQRDLALWFVGGSAAAFLLFRGAGDLIKLAAERAPRPGGTRLRLALGNLHRPGAPTAGIVLSLGLGLTVLVAIAAIQGNLANEISSRLPARAPTFFFIDIQSTQLAEFERVLKEQPGVSQVERVPSLRGRIIRIKGEPVDRAKVAPEASWAVDSDRGLTYAAEPPKGARIVAGQWWPADYKGPPQISFDANVAKGLGLAVGDAMTISVLGRDVEVTIANLRDIDYTTFGINFSIIFAPGFLEAAPHTFLATASVGPGQEDAVLRAVTDRFPNISAVKVKDALDTVATMLGAIGGAARSVAALTLAVGTLVLAGAMIAGHRRRVQDAVVLKVLGATRRDVLGAFLLEYGLLGVATALVASVLGTIAAYGVVVGLMKAPWVFLPGTVVGTVLLSAAITILIGLVGTWRALGQKAAPLLREA